MSVVYALTALPLVGCSGASPPGPDTGGSGEFTVGQLVGEYRAGKLVANEGQADEFDAIARGGELTIVLAVDGTTSGRLFVPGGADDGSDLDSPMIGTWTLSNGNKIDFDQQWDTFVRDMTFTATQGADGIVLSGRETFPGPFTVEAVLNKV